MRAANGKCKHEVREIKMRISQEDNNNTDHSRAKHDLHQCIIFFKFYEHAYCDKLLNFLN